MQAFTGVSFGSAMPSEVVDLTKEVVEARGGRSDARSGSSGNGKEPAWAEAWSEGAVTTSGVGAVGGGGKGKGRAETGSERGDKGRSGGESSGGGSRGGRSGHLGETGSSQAGEEQSDVERAVVSGWRQTSTRGGAGAMRAQSTKEQVQGVRRGQHLPAQSDKEPVQDVQSRQGRLDAAGSRGA